MRKTQNIYNVVINRGYIETMVGPCKLENYNLFYKAENESDLIIRVLKDYPTYGLQDITVRLICNESKIISLDAPVDCHFHDSYGKPVQHGTRIIIEANYNFGHLNNAEALVEWHPEKGMYKFVMLTNKLKSSNNFEGIKRFKVLDKT